MMVFIFNEKGEILLTQHTEEWNTYLFETTRKVQIREMVCDELQQRGILTSPKVLTFYGIIENRGGSVFVYATRRFRVVNLHPNSLWYLESVVPNLALGRLEKSILPEILKGEKIGIPMYPPA